MQLREWGEEREEGIVKEWRNTLVLLLYSFLHTKYSEQASQNGCSVRKPQFDHDLYNTHNHTTIYVPAGCVYAQRDQLT